MRIFFCGKFLRAIYIYIEIRICRTSLEYIYLMQPFPSQKKVLFEPDQHTFLKSFRSIVTISMGVSTPKIETLDLLPLFLICINILLKQNTWWFKCPGLSHQGMASSPEKTSGIQFHEPHPSQCEFPTSLLERKISRICFLRDVFFAIYSIISPPQESSRLLRNSTTEHSTVRGR